MRDWSITARLSSVSVPALILVGEFDTMTEECSMLIVDNIPGARPLVTIPRAGELLPIISLIHAIYKNRVVAVTHISYLQGTANSSTSPNFVCRL